MIQRCVQWRQRLGPSIPFFPFALGLPGTTRSFRDFAKDWGNHGIVEALRAEWSIFRLPEKRTRRWVSHLAPILAGQRAGE